ncbi:MAG: class I SAM-dependent rRNA methyltransferase [Paracoccaceae bacterium]|nr:class I SAM-dependent rRNA methyltransferase [Paracoccaceae bacterium]
MSDRPVIRLKPKIDPRPIRRGFPWVYANQLVTDRRTKALEPGSIALLEDDDRRPLGTAIINPKSKIIARLLDSDGAARIDADWFRARIRHALDLRETLYDTPYYRMIHAEADGLPGTVVDRFGDTVVIQPNAAWIEARLDVFVNVLSDVTGAMTVVKNAQGRARGLEGLDDASTILRGAVSGPLPVPMNGATYLADVVGGQKTGLFFDQRPNHAFVARLSRGRDVLDVFSHVGGFALAALAGGARSALAIDGSAPALELAVGGAELTGVADQFETRKADAFDALTELAGEGRRFGSVICDPPAFAPSKNALEAGLRAYEKVARLAAHLVEPGGFLTLCSCSQAAGLAAFQTACQRGLGRAGRSAQLVRTGFAGPDHPRHPALEESGYLKALSYRLS